VATDSEWQAWGARDPYFAVLTNPKYRSAVLTPERKQEFFVSGKNTVDSILSKCRHYLDPGFAPSRVLDFGCGVARLSIPFAAHAQEVVGVDVAPAMLAEARRNCAEQGCSNVTLVLSDDSLSQVNGQFDLVLSCIVLQHVELARGRTLFAALVEKIRPGGCGVIQLPYGCEFYPDTFGVPPPPPARPPPSGFVAEFTTVARRILARFGSSPPAPEVTPPLEPPDPEMQMNYYNLSELMFILQRAGIHHVVSDFTNHGGALGVFMFFQKPLMS